MFHVKRSQVHFPFASQRESPGKSALSGSACFQPHPFPLSVCKADIFSCFSVSMLINSFSFTFPQVSMTYLFLLPPRRRQIQERSAVCFPLTQGPMASPLLCFISSGDKFLRKDETNCASPGQPVPSETTKSHHLPHTMHHAKVSFYLSFKKAGQS